jgi:hypothetical protein
MVDEARILAASISEAAGLPRSTKLEKMETRRPWKEGGLTESRSSQGPALSGSRPIEKSAAKRALRRRRRVRHPE